MLLSFPCWCVDGIRDDMIVICFLLVSIHHFILFDMLGKLLIYWMLSLTLCHCSFLNPSINKFSVSIFGWPSHCMSNTKVMDQARFHDCLLFNMINDDDARWPYFEHNYLCILAQAHVEMNFWKVLSTNLSTKTKHTLIDLIENNRRFSIKMQHGNNNDYRYLKVLTVMIKTIVSIRYELDPFLRHWCNDPIRFCLFIHTVCVCVCVCVFGVEKCKAADFMWETLTNINYYCY